MSLRHPTRPETGTAWRLAVVAVFGIGSLLTLLALDPIPQDPAYHAFRDTRPLFGIPNGLDVLSNLPFLLVGAWGARATLRRCPAETLAAWLTFCVGAALVGVGSAWYHLDPTDETLVWDRLPMTVAFMALSVLVLGEFFGRAFVGRLLLPAVLTGVGSVAWWHATGDLRLYAWVQFMPLGAIVLLLVLYPRRLERRGPLLTALGLYVLAKVLEHQDTALFRMTLETVSGHTLKHLAAAAGCLAVLALPGGPLGQPADRSRPRPDPTHLP